MRELKHFRRPYWLALLPAIGCASCHQTSNQTGLLNQIGWKRQRKPKKRGGRGEGEPQCAMIYCCPPKSRRSGITFPYLLVCEMKNWPRKVAAEVPRPWKKSEATRAIAHTWKRHKKHHFLWRRNLLNSREAREGGSQWKKFEVFVQKCWKLLFIKIKSLWLVFLK